MNLDWLCMNMQLCFRIKMNNKASDQSIELVFFCNFHNGRFVSKSWRMAWLTYNIML